MRTERSHAALVIAIVLGAAVSIAALTGSLASLLLVTAAAVLLIMQAAEAIPVVPTLITPAKRVAAPRQEAQARPSAGTPGEIAGRHRRRDRRYWEAEDEAATTAWLDAIHDVTHTDHASQNSHAVSRETPQAQNASQQASEDTVVLAVTQLTGASQDAGGAQPVSASQDANGAQTRGASPATHGAQERSASQEVYGAWADETALLVPLTLPLTDLVHSWTTASLDEYEANLPGYGAQEVGPSLT